MTTLEVKPLALRVLGYDDQGRPDVVQVLHDDSTVDLREGSVEFLVIGWVDTQGTQPFAPNASKIGAQPPTQESLAAASEDDASGGT